MRLATIESDEYAIIKALRISYAGFVRIIHLEIMRSRKEIVGCLLDIAE